MAAAGTLQVASSRHILDHNALNDLLDRAAVEGNLVNGLDEGEGSQDASRFQKRIHFHGGKGALQLLSIQQFGFHFFPLLLALRIIHEGIRSGRTLAAHGVFSTPILGILTAHSRFAGGHALLGKGFGTKTIASTVARGNKIGHTATLGKGLVFHTIKEHATKLGHFSQAHAQESGLGVASHAQGVDKASAEGHNIFEGPADFGTSHIRHVLDSEVG
mmetsp:Transcript_21470/g.44785  ORF Transcript_21470/g.44785 Transcript_21470/m.44785 type:complete len:217 (+) Transcript_21470:422-1072(+)